MQVTDRPNPQITDRPSSQITDQPSLPATDESRTQHTISESDLQDPQPGPSGSALPETITPASVRPLPKAAARKTKAITARKKLSSTILTKTPVKERLREEQTNQKLKKTNIRKLSSPVNTKPLKKQCRKRKKDVSDSSDSDDADENQTTVRDEEQTGEMKQRDHLDLSSDSADDVDDVRPFDENELDEDVNIRHEHLKQGDYVVVQFIGLKNKPTCHYIARIDNMVTDDLDIEVTYLQKMKVIIGDGGPERFVIPEPSQTYQVPLEDIIRKLPDPLISGGTKRIARQIVFPLSLLNYNLA